MGLIELKYSQLSDFHHAKYHILAKNISKVIPGAYITLKVYELYKTKENRSQALKSILKIRDNHVVVVEKRTKNDVLICLIDTLLDYLYHYKKNSLILFKEHYEVRVFLRELLKMNGKSRVVNIYVPKQKALEYFQITCPRCLSGMSFKGNNTLLCEKCGFYTEKLRLNIKAHESTIYIMTVDDFLRELANGNILEYVENVGLIATAVLSSMNVELMQWILLISAYYEALFKSSIKAIVFVTSVSKELFSENFQNLKIILFQEGKYKSTYDIKKLITYTLRPTYFSLSLFLELINYLARQISRDLLVLIEDEHTCSLLRKIVVHENVKVINTKEAVALDCSNVDTIVIIGPDESRALHTISEVSFFSNAITLIIIPIEELNTTFHASLDNMRTSFESFNALASLIALLMLYNITDKESLKNGALINVVDRLIKIALSRQYLDLLKLTISNADDAKKTLMKLIETLQAVRLVAELLDCEETLENIERVIEIENTQKLLLTHLRQLNTAIECFKKLNTDTIKRQLQLVLNHIKNNFCVDINNEEILLICKDFIDNVNIVLSNVKELLVLLDKLTKISEKELEEIDELLNNCLEKSEASIRHIRILNARLHYNFDKKAHPSIVTEIVTTMRLYHMMKHRPLSKLVESLITIHNILISIIKQLKRFESGLGMIDHEVYRKIRSVTEKYRIPTKLLVTITNDINHYSSSLSKTAYLLAQMYAPKHSGVDNI